MDLGQQRQALKERIDQAGIAALHVYARKPGKLDIPSGGLACWIEPIAGEFELNFGTGDQTRTQFALQCRASLAGGRENAEAVMDLYLGQTGARSLRAAVRTDTHQSGQVSMAIVTGWHDYEPIEEGEGEAALLFLGAVLDVVVEFYA